MSPESRLLDSTLDHVVPRTPSAGTPDVWLITFSDLLTLVLGFFLVVISLSDIGKRTPPVEVATDNPNAVTVSAARGDRESGTAIAEVITSPSVSEFHLRSSDFENGSAALDSDRLEKIKKAVALTGYKESQIRIETCSESGGEQDGQNWFIALGRVSALRRQLLDAGVGGNPIEMRVLGAHCHLLAAAGGAGGTDGTEAVIRISKRYVAHG